MAWLPGICADEKSLTTWADQGTSCGEGGGAPVTTDHALALAPNPKTAPKTSQDQPVFHYSGQFLAKFIECKCTGISVSPVFATRKVAHTGPN
jgi:hypothetical protein